MSKCSNCGYSHEGVGQSPDHPAEIGSGWIAAILIGVVSFVVMIVIS